MQTELIGLNSYGPWNERLLDIRNRSFSAKAWLRRKQHFGNEKFNSDFRAGFRAGYEEVAAGGNGCCPAVPPRNYWTWEFQSREGHGRTEAWFAGYPQGARAAEEDGVANWNKMPISVGTKSQYQQAGMPLQKESSYPIPEPDAVGIPTNGFPPNGIPMERVPAEGIPANGTPIPFPNQAIPTVPNSGAIAP